MKRTYDAFTLKMVAIIGMLLQHTAIVFHEVIPFGLEIPMHFAGGLTFPILAFFLVEGYKHTSNVGKYMRRIFLFAVISQIPYTMAFSRLIPIFSLNIMATLLLGLVLLWLYDKIKSRGLFWFIFVLLVAVSLVFDWGIIGPIMIIMYRVISDEKRRRVAPSIFAGTANIVMNLIAFVGVMLIFLAESTTQSVSQAVDLTLASIAETGINPILAVMFAIGSLCAIPLIRRYNGERGRSMKWMFYIFYPLHFVVLLLIGYAFGIFDFIFRIF